jgi:hypothetical protein
MALSIKCRYAECRDYLNVLLSVVIVECQGAQKIVRLITKINSIIKNSKKHCVE